MSHGHASVSLRDVPDIVRAQAPTISAAAKAAFVVLAVVGVVGFVATLASDPQRAWSVLHVNVAYWFVLAAASCGFAAVFHICNAQWARPLSRLFESPADFMCWMILPFLLLYIGGYDHIFFLHETLHDAKAVWLSKHFMYVRDALVMLLLIWVTRKVISLGIRQDIGAIRSGLTGLAEADIQRWKSSAYDRYVSDWSGDTTSELQRTHDLRGKLSPVVVIVYALAISLFAFDQIMSVDPLWISTLFGAFVFMTGVYAAVAWNGMGVGILRAIHPLFRAKITRPIVHDLGNLVFGFGIFWAYLFWSHYLTIWYGNLPEETGWLITRARLQPWHGLGWGILFCLFFFPFFFGLNKDGKAVPRLLFIVGSVIAIGSWLLMFILVIPTLSPHSIPLGWQELSITLGFVGLFLLSSSQYLQRVPLIPFGDLYLPKKER